MEQKDFVNPVRSLPLQDNSSLQSGESAANTGDKSSKTFVANSVKPHASNGVKLTDTVYGMLEFFPDSEPLKNKAKERALLIMDNLSLIFGNEEWVQIKNCLPGIRERAALETSENISKLLNYLQLAKNRGWTNGLSCLIIQNEYEKVKKDIELLLKDKKGQSILASEIVVDIGGAEISEPVNLQEVSSPLNPVRNSISSGVKFTKRQELIIKFLRENQKAQVSNLMAVLPNVTKRTIRRDMDELLKMGKVVRTGQFNQVVYKMS